MNILDNVVYKSKEHSHNFVINLPKNFGHHKKSWEKLRRGLFLDVLDELNPNLKSVCLKNLDYEISKLSCLVVRNCRLK
jgi:hypothetical protein